jgi:hypothetical protein
MRSLQRQSKLVLENYCPKKCSDPEVAPKCALTPNLMRTESAVYQSVLDAQRNRGGPWTKVAAGHLDLCAAPIPVREQ